MRAIEGIPNPLTAQHASSAEIDTAIPQFHLQNLGKDADGNDIEWPTLEGFDEKHAMNTAKLALVILSYTYPELNDDKHQAIMWTAALFHDLGRQEDWRQEDNNVSEHSASLLDKILRNPTHGVEMNAELREAACKLVANHKPGAERMPTDPLARCLWDADAYEAARIRPNTYEGLQFMKKYTSADRLCTDWAKERSNLKRYMDWRGWA